MDLCRFASCLKLRVVISEYMNMALSHIRVFTNLVSG